MSARKIPSRKNQPPTTCCHQHYPMHTDEYKQDFTGTSPKRAYKNRKIEHPSGSLLPPAFWDNLSEFWLTSNALRELDRRNKQATANVAPERQFLKPVTRNEAKPIQRFARQGGPDLSDLRGYPEPTMKARPYRIQKFRKRRVRHSRDSSASSRGSSTSQCTKPLTTKSSGPYDRHFQQHLTNHGVFPYRYQFPDGRRPTKPSNWDGILARLARRRPSLSSSRFTEEDFEKFLQVDADASKERQVTETVVTPFIEGGVPDNKCTNGGISFRNLDHLTDGTLVPGNPDRYDGARPEQLDVQIQVELNHQIVPSMQHDLPIAPNFFLAVKGPDGSASVAKRQACYDGALGARGLHSLQEYGKDEPEFDNNASTLTSIYHNGQLQMFTSHPSKSATSDRTEYHMTQLRSFSMADNPDTFREGATWYRNGRDWAKEQRDEAIRRANDKAKNIVSVNALSSTEPVAPIA